MSGTINPIYKPEWEIDQDENGINKVYVDTTSKELTITLRASSYKYQNINSEVTIDYASDVTSTLELSDITVYINGVEVTSATNPEIEVSEGTESTNATSSKKDILHTIVLSNLEEASRQAGLPYKELSGNIGLKIKGRGQDSSTYLENVVTDVYGNQNMMETDQNGTNADGTWIPITFDTGEETDHNADGAMFADFIKPEFTYQYSESDIDHDEKTLTVGFLVVDKYFESSSLEVEDLTIFIDGEEPEWRTAGGTTGVTRTLAIKTIDADVTDETTGLTYKTDGSIEYNGAKIGERYELVLSNLEQNPNDAYNYSGIVAICIPEGIASDKSGNTSNAQTITVGVDENDGNFNTDIDENGQIVDVVDPVWELGDIDLANGTIKLIAKDKYFSSVDIDENDITIKVNGIESTAVEKDITSITPTDIYDTVSGVENTLVGKEYTLQLSNIVPEGGGYAQFEPTNKDTDGIIVDENGYAYYKAENGGTVSIEIAADTITDQYGNANIKQELDVGIIDTTNPEVYDVQKIQDAEANTETIIFNVTDKNYDSTDLVEINKDTDEDGVADYSEITLWIDDVQIDELIENATLTSKEIWGMPEGTTEAVILGHQYTLVISNIAETVKQTDPAKDYLEWSGTVKIEIAESAAKDIKGNTLNTSTTTITDFVDYIKPQVEEVVVTDAINETDKTYTMSFTIIDKYLDTTDMVTEDEITVYVDGEEASSITKNLTSTAITATMNKTVNGVVTNGTYTIGHTYTLVLSEFEETSKQTDKNKDFMEWSGTVTIEIAETALKDTTGNTLDSETVNRTVGGAHIDFIKPVLEKVSSTPDSTAGTETIIFNIMDKYLDTSDALVDSEMTVYVDGEETSGLSMTLTKAQDFTYTVNSDSTHVVGQQYQLVLSGFEQASRNAKDYKDWGGTVTIEIAETAVKDITVTNSNGEVAGGNTLDSAEANRTVTGNFVDFIKPDLKYTHSASDIDLTNKKYTMTFDITDKYYTSGELTLNDLAILMQNGQKDSSGNAIVYDLIQLANDGKIDISFGATEKTATFNKTVGGTVANGTYTIGHEYTLTIEGLEQLYIGDNLTTADYSGVITVTVDENIVKDSGSNGDGTNTNGNDVTSITSGVSVSGGVESGTATEVDVVDPLWNKVSTSANAINGTASITVRGTDTYFNTDDTDASTLTSDEIEIYINGTKNTTITPTISAVTALTEDRIVGGVNTTGVQYGVEYTISFTGFAQDVNQVKIRILEDAITDDSGSGNKETDLIVYNVLKSAESETAADSKFLGSTDTAIQRQKIENVTFVSLTEKTMDSWATLVGTDSSYWDVSAQGDKSIVAHYKDENSNGAYEVEIGSHWEIFANQQSDYLFSYIGYDGSCTATETISDIELLNTSAVTDMSNMFQYCGYNAMTTLDLGTEFDTSNVTNMYYMFNNCGYKAMGTLDLGDSFDTSSVTNMNFMFQDCGYTAMTSFVMGDGFDTSSVTGMSSMFNRFGYTALTSLDLGDNFDTSSVNNMYYMFGSCGYTAMVSLDLGDNFDTSGVTGNMISMFQKCGYTAMTSLDLGDKFDTSNVKSMSSMFNQCGYTAMTKLDLGDNFDTGSVTDMSTMFYFCGYTEMTSLDLGDKFDTSGVTNMTRMFNSCGNTKMTVLDLGPAFTTIANTNSSMFTDCGTSELKIYAPEAIYANSTSFK